MKTKFYALYNNHKGLQYQYLGEFTSFDNADEAATQWNVDNTYHIVWISDKTELLNLKDSITNELTK